MLTQVCKNGKFRFNLKLFLCLCGSVLNRKLRLAFLPLLQACKTLTAIYFSELTQNASLLFFRKKINKNIAEKFCLISEIRTKLCRKTLPKNFVLKIRCVKLSSTNQVGVTLESRKPNFVDKLCANF